MATVSNNSTVPDRCSACRAEYRNVQHPAKPLGVSIQRLCDCLPVTTTFMVDEHNSVSTTVLVPPEKSA